MSEPTIGVCWFHEGRTPTNPCGVFTTSDLLTGFNALTHAVVCFGDNHFVLACNGEDVDIPEDHPAWDVGAEFLKKMKVHQHYAEQLAQAKMN